RQPREVGERHRGVEQQQFPTRAPFNGFETEVGAVVKQVLRVGASEASNHYVYSMTRNVQRQPFWKARPSEAECQAGELKFEIETPCRRATGGVLRRRLKLMN
ncbi:MAG TPA: hypothetical protein VEF03_02255, partial [Candidatus Binataceae bacterium]|nr:hypothetical protein [Candidatus Binataceae bacterium]